MLLTEMVTELFPQVMVPPVAVITGDTWSLITWTVALVVQPVDCAVAVTVYVPACVTVALGVVALNDGPVHR